jgi:thioredoxin reductase (NADPH)
VIIHGGVRVQQISAQPHGFDVNTSAGVYRARTVLLATGRRGSPRRLGVPGEELPKVVFSLDSAAQYRGQHVLVVGGGDSALEAAIELSRHPLASVTLAYRGNSFDRARPNNRRKLDDAVRAGKLIVLVDTEVRAIEQGHVILDQTSTGQPFRMTPHNDAVIVCIGGLLPSNLLADVGVRVETKYGTA